MTRQLEVRPEPRSDVDVLVGRNAHELLFYRHRRQNQLAEAVGVSSSVLGKKLRGESSWSARQLQATADFLDVEICRLFEVTTQRNFAHRHVQPNGGQPEVTGHRLAERLATVSRITDIRRHNVPPPERPW